jgi:hypothetical protein
MTRERLVSDNPFRLLSTPSESSYQVLRRKADAVAHAAKVGILPEVPFADEFGADLEDLPSKVRSLATDPVSLCLYRMLWPLEEPMMTALVDCSSVSANSVKRATIEQGKFLDPWYQFLLTESAPDLTAALDAGYRLSRSEGFIRFLSARLANEAGISHKEAEEQVSRATEQLLDYLATRSCRTAARTWERGDSSRAARLAKVLLDSPLPASVKEPALGPLGACGDELQEQVVAMTDAMTPWRCGASTNAPEEVVRLAELAELLKGVYPSATDWAATATSWRSALCWSMAKESSRLVDENKKGVALEIILLALTISTDEEQKAILRLQRRALQEIMEDDKCAEAYSDIHPLNSAPKMYTLYGFGTKLYSDIPFPGDRRLKLANLYFMALYMPLLPIARYLVDDMGGGRWRFHGTAPWTSAMKAHLAVASVAIATFVTFLTITPGSSGSPSAAPISGSVESSSRATQGMYRDPKEAQLERVKSQLRDLQSELDGLDGEISNRKAQLRVDKQAIEDLKQRIERTYVDETSQEEVDRYDAMVRRFKSQLSQYNDRIDQLNKIVVQQNKRVAEEERLVQKHNELLKELQASP